MGTCIGRKTSSDSIKRCTEEETGHEKGRAEAASEGRVPGGTGGLEMSNEEKANHPEDSYLLRRSPIIAHGTRRQSWPGTARSHDAAVGHPFSLQSSLFAWDVCGYVYMYVHTYILCTYLVLPTRADALCASRFTPSYELRLGSAFRSRTSELETQRAEAAHSAQPSAFSIHNGKGPRWIGQENHILFLWPDSRLVRSPILRLASPRY